MLQYNPTVTGSLQVSGDITGTVNGINITGLSQSVSTQLISVQVSTGSSDAKFETLSGVTSSALTRLTNIESKSASVDISISNINSITASNIARLSNLETKSSSVDISISNINSFTSSNDTKFTTLGTYTGSLDTKNTTLADVTSSLISKTGSYATTGSNQFYGTQVFSGSVFIENDLVVQGSSSIQYISASSVSIGTNIVQLNTANPSVRFAGLTIIDSGSIGGSGSFLYDSVHDEFVFVHRGNGTNVTSSHFVLGPETYDSLGNETYLTSNIIPKGTGKEHLIDSCIFDNGTTTCIKNNLIGTGTISGTTIYGSTAVCSPSIIACTTSAAAITIDGYSKLSFKDRGTEYGTINASRYNFGGESTMMSFQSGNCFLFLNGTNCLMFIGSNGNVGIGTTNPSYLLDVRCSATSGAPIVGNFQSAGGDAQLYVANGTITTQLTADNTNSISIVGSMTNHPLVIRTGNTERMRITYSNGYVGINNCIPLDRLDVAGTIRATVNTSYFTTFGYTGGTQIRMVSPIGETADNMVFKIDGASSGTAGNQFIFQTQVGNTTPVTTLWINKLGDVNIGTTTSTKYQVLNLINDANTVGAAIGLARSSAQFITNAGAGDLIIGNGTGKNILFGNTGAGTTEYMRITSGGTVTKPLQPAFSAGKNTNSSVSAGATVIFQLTTGNKFNIGGHYNASTGIFTAPVAGVYIFSASIIWMNVPNGTAMDDSFWIYKNSSIVAYGLRRAEYEVGYTGNGGYFVDHANVLLSLAVGDTVKVVNNRTLDIHGNSEFSYFYGYLLG